MSFALNHPAISKLIAGTLLSPIMNVATASTTELAASGKRRLPGDEDVWIFIFFEMLMFGAFFVSYIVYWMMDVEPYTASQLKLDRSLGLINTLFLVISSWAVVTAVNQARRDRPQSVAPYLSVAIVLGLSFMVVKYIEYSAKLGEGLSLTTDGFFMFYFCLTGIHLLHVVAGTVILVVMWLKARQGAYHAKTLKGLETGASYWHMVDLLWIFLFPLLYLLR